MDSADLPRAPGIHHLRAVRATSADARCQRRRPQLSEERRAGPAREVPRYCKASSSCGKCGKRMTVNYHARCNGELVPNYHPPPGIATGTPPCQTINGAGVTKRSPRSCSNSSRRWRSKRRSPSPPRPPNSLPDLQLGVQRAETAAHTARRRYLAVDPTNRSLPTSRS